MDVLPPLGLISDKSLPFVLDKKYRRILAQLGKNVRASHSQIARAVGLSRDSVRYRTGILSKEGVLRGSRTVVDVSLLGYQSYHLFLSIKNPDLHIRQGLIDKLVRLSFVRVVLALYGEYDFEIAVIAKTVDELDSHIAEIIEITKDYLRELELLIVSRSLVARSFPLSFSSDEVSLRPSSKKILPDSVDLAILKVIRNDASLSLLEIGKKVKLSHDVVSYRLKKMEKSFIKSYIPVVNYHKLGYATHVLLFSFHTLDRENEAKLERFFKSQESILWAVKTIGSYSVLAYVEIHTTEELQTLIESIRTEFAEQMTRYRSLIASAEYAYTYAPDCIFGN